MVSELRAAYKQGDLDRLTDNTSVSRVFKELMSVPWVVYARSTCHHSDTVLAYLARYTHRIAISNHRLQRMEGDAVVFRYKDYALDGTNRTMKLAGEEFVRRFLLHVLPHGLMRIRHYGFLANCHRRKRLAQIRHCLQSTGHRGEASGNRDETSTQVGAGCEPVEVCPRCHQGVLRKMSEIVPLTRRRRS